MSWSRRAFLSAATGLSQMLPAAPQRPNIVFIWGDNLAYADVGVYGNPNAKTPALDRMAEQGVRFTQFYVAHVVCSPSRCGLLTGRQPFRSGIVHVLRPDSPSGIPADEITLAEALRAQGYATLHIGKWHLGDRREYLPTQHGFDHYFGIPYSMDMAPTHLYRDNEIIEDLEGSKVETITERYADEAIQFIARNRNRPFFLYFSHTLPHHPLNLPPRALNPGRSLYDDAITHLDEQTGRVLAALDKYNLSENTLVIFSSDNGPSRAGGNTGGLRGGITDAHEGGLRAPFIARWPGKLPAGKIIRTPAIAYDVFPTLVRLAGGKLDPNRIYDGQDIWPLTSGQGEFRREKPFIWVFLDNVTTIRDGPWKMHVGHREAALPKPELYNIEEDPGETRSILDNHPEIAARLRRQIEEFQATVPKAWRLDYVVRDPRKLKSGVRKR